MLETRTGNTLSSKSSEAANLYQKAVDLILGSETGAAETLDKALELDKNFALAAAARYYVAQDVGEPGANTYKQLAERTSLDASDWEREHINVLIGLIDEAGATQARALAYIETTPTDLLIVAKLSGNMFFYDGPKKLETVLSVFESDEHASGDDWAFLSRLGFAASEAGPRKRVLTLIERALVIRPRSLYHLHGLAHLLHHVGTPEEPAK